MTSAHLVPRREIAALADTVEMFEPPDSCYQRDVLLTRRHTPRSSCGGYPRDGTVRKELVRVAMHKHVTKTYAMTL